MMYDLLIIGGGCSGLSASIYAARLGLKSLTLTGLTGGLITTTHLVENWPGIKSISGPDLAFSLYEHAQASGGELKSEFAQSIVKTLTGDFLVKTGTGEYQSKAILLATGTKHKKLEVPGEKELENKGVSYCALCDGAFFKNKVVCVVGGGDSAAKEAIFLSEHAKKVYIIVRKNILRAEPINSQRIAENSKIVILYETEIAEILGTDKVEKIRFKSSGPNSGKEIAIDGVFLAVGHTAQTDLAKSLGVELNEKGEIKINRRSETNVPGVFAAGDCVDTEFKQAIVGSAEAVIAAYFAYEYCK